MRTPSILLTIVLAATVAAGCGEERRPDAGATAGSVSKTFPITGRTPSGARYRVSPGKPSPDDDVVASWCLRLAYTGAITLVDDAGHRDPFTNGLDTCGTAPAPMLSGEIHVNCAADDLFVFGQARPGAGGVVLETAGGETIAARRGPPVPDSGFDGFSYVLTARLDQLPASVRSAADGKQRARIPRRSAVCRRFPGAGRSEIAPLLSFP